MKKASLNFHQTFAPERDYLSRLLSIADDSRSLTKEQIFELTGIPTGKSSGKVEPHIHYATHMRLLVDNVVDGQHNLQRTELGRLVHEADPYFMEPVTMLVCHYNLSSPIKGAALWSFVFNRVIPGLGLTIDVGTMQTIANRELHSAKVNLTPFRVCYTADKCFGQLGLLEVDTSSWMFRATPYRREFRYAYANTLLSTWEALEPDRRELTIDEIQDVLQWNKPFAWGERETASALDALADARIITLNKQLSPTTVIRNELAQTVLGQLYSMLA